jgi:hypothetical protein
MAALVAEGQVNPLTPACNDGENVRVHEFVTHCNMFIAWSFGNLQGGLQGDVARLASKQRLLTKWTAV